MNTEERLRGMIRARCGVTRVTLRRNEVQGLLPEFGLPRDDRYWRKIVEANILQAVPAPGHPRYNVEAVVRAFKELTGEG